ncbi:hypothetical protein AAGS61_11900 [Lysinibacillus sp. KU-BSD001]|uniref:hypothetical protein n=1 Tax=Lysinibacillus sp. KU-BSD001 TaxID=3141328 RepID=UPI0036EBAD9C
MATKKANIIALIVIALVGFLLFRQDVSPSIEETVEVKLAATLSQIEGVGQVSVYFHTEASAESTLFSFSASENKATYTGVLIVSEGAQSPIIRRQLQEAVSAVLQLPAHQIIILPMKKEDHHES